MDLGTVLSVAQTLFAAIQCSELRELCSALGYESQLDSLAKTVNTVKAVLLDAEARRELTNEAQLYIERLKDAVFDADDLLDECVTLAQRKHDKIKKGGKVSDKVRRFFSHFMDLAVAHRMSRNVKAMKKQLDAIAEDHTKFGLKLDSEPIRKRREDTCSYVYEPDIIGRDDDREYIVGKLLDSDVKRDDVSFLTIVGMGGLGKTALAQLIYKDERITQQFSQRLWVCVADEDPKHLSMQAVLAKIIESSKGPKHGDSSKEWLQNQVREMLHGKKYLLVLDDIWNENREDWVVLENFLKGGSSGSWVLVTTRSSHTARIIGDGSCYNLQGLSDKDSWCLFQRVALGHNEDQTNSTDLVEIGKDIAQKCANVPLALRVVGSLLYGQRKDKWLQFQNTKLAEITHEGNDIFPILKLSYDNLESPLKACFSYCALFPKDYIIKKETLIELWMAQGYVEQLNKAKSMEDISEEYFFILLRRCFFQDIKKDENDEIIWFKIHDLMHDVAQGVTRHEICFVDFIPNELDEKIRHISFKEWSRGGNLTKIKARTFHRLYRRINDFPVDEVLGNCMHLRALDLCNSKISELPDSICQLLHLRCIDLSGNSDMKVLPNSITKLHNLQTLNLYGCKGLVELPKTFSKLSKLMFLDTDGCDGLTHMPMGMGRLSCLSKLPLFVVDATNSGSVEQLESLEALTKLKGKLRIKIGNSKKVGEYVKMEGSQRGYLTNKEHLKEIELCFEDAWSKKAVKYEEALMEDMEPHPILRKIQLHSYYGVEMPSWAREQTFAERFPNLVRIELHDCKWLQHIPCLSGLRHLRSLILYWLQELEYIEEENTSSGIISDAGGRATASASAATQEQLPFFPSLVELELSSLPQLKGWWRGVESSGVVGDDAYRLLFPSFPCLSKLKIEHCEKLSCIPLCPPGLEKLVLRGLNEKLRIMERDGGRSLGRDGRTSLEFENYLKLRKIETDKVRHLNWVLPVQALRCLTELRISRDSELERLEEAEEVWKNCSSSLKSLEFYNCSELRSVSGGLQHLTSLKSLKFDHCRELRSVSGGLQHLTSLEVLEIWDCSNLRLSEEGDENGSTSTTPLPCPWQSLQHCLRSLTLVDLPMVVNLPEEMQHLSSLRILSICYCEALKSLPEWMPNLTSLHTLSISWWDALESLPEWMPNLTSLHTLSISCWDALESLPEWMPNLTSLQSLEIWYCKALKSISVLIPNLTRLDIRGCSEALQRRCSKSPPGEDWPNIQHIPHIDISSEIPFFQPSPPRFLVRRFI